MCAQQPHEKASHLAVDEELSEVLSSNGQPSSRKKVRPSFVRHNQLGMPLLSLQASLVRDQYALSPTLDSKGKVMQYTMLDKKDIRVWRGAQCIAKLSNPHSRGSCTYRCCCYHAAANVCLVATADMSMLVLAQTLEVISIVPLPKIKVQQLAYVHRTEEVLVAGSIGLRAYRLVGQQTGPQQSLQSAHRRWILHLTRIFDCKIWVSSFQYHPINETAVVCWPDDGHVEIFKISQRESIVRLEASLHERQITDAILFPASYYLITSCQAGAIKIWYHAKDAVTPNENDMHMQSENRLCESNGNNRADKESSPHQLTSTAVSHLYTFDGHVRAVTKLDLDSVAQKTIGSASLDCTVRIWNIETLELTFLVEVASRRPLVALIISEFSYIVSDDHGSVFEYARHAQANLQDDDDIEEEYEIEEEGSPTCETSTLDDLKLMPAQRPDEAKSLLRTPTLEHHQFSFARQNRCVSWAEPSKVTRSPTRVEVENIVIPSLALPPVDKIMVRVLKMRNARKHTSPGIVAYDLAVSFVNRVVAYCKRNAPTSNSFTEHPTVEESQDCTDKTKFKSTQHPSSLTHIHNRSRISPLRPPRPLVLSLDVKQQGQCSSAKSDKAAITSVNLEPCSQMNGIESTSMCRDKRALKSRLGGTDLPVCSIRPRRPSKAPHVHLRRAARRKLSWRTSPHVYSCGGQRAPS